MVLQYVHTQSTQIKKYTATPEVQLLIGFGLL